MALQTDGYAVLNTGHVAEGLQKIFRDVGSYYLMSYYSTNQKLDGRFRRIRVEVKRPGADVRARPGYLAPTEAEARAAGAAMDRAATKPARRRPSRARSIRSRRHAATCRCGRRQSGGRHSIRAIVELDAGDGEATGVDVGRHAAGDVRARGGRGRNRPARRKR